MAALLTQLPTWQMIRALGLISYFLLFAGVSLGIAYSMPFWKGKSKATLYQAHSAATTSGSFIGLLHGMILAIDTYMPFAWKEIFVPFAAQDKPFRNGLGTLALYGMLAIIFTTDIRNKLSKKLWRAIHVCSYPTFLCALAHGLASGTDSKNIWIETLYAASVAVILTLLVVRFSVRGKKQRSDRTGKQHGVNSLDRGEV